MEELGYDSVPMKNTNYTSTTTLMRGMRCRTVFLHSEQSMATDVPQSLGGLGEMPPPGAVLAATLASCMLSMLAFVAKRRGMELKGIRIHAACTEGAQGISGFELDICAPEDTPEEWRSIMQNTVKNCPVANALRTDIPKNIRWHFTEA